MGDRHAGRRYVVVGGTTGMGAAAARLIADEGGKVCVIGRDTAKAAAAAEGLDSGRGVIIAEATGGEGLEPALLRAAERLGEIHGVAVTAGPMVNRGTLLELTDADWLAMYEAQVLPVVQTSRTLLPLMIASGGGTLVTTAAYSMRAQKQVLPHYAAMKSAIASLTKNIARHYGDQGIRANCIAPGAFATEALAEARQAAAQRYGDDGDEALNRLMIDDWGMKVALNRIGKPAEAGELISFLLSREASYMTGALINIDGGTDF